MLYYISKGVGVGDLEQRQGDFRIVKDTDSTCSIFTKLTSNYVTLVVSMLISLEHIDLVVALLIYYNDNI